MTTTTRKDPPVSILQAFDEHLEQLTQASPLLYDSDYRRFTAAAAEAIADAVRDDADAFDLHRHLSLIAQCAGAALQDLYGYKGRVRGLWDPQDPADQARREHALITQDLADQAAGLLTAAAKRYALANVDRAREIVWMAEIAAADAAPLPTQAAPAAADAIAF